MKREAPPALNQCMSTTPLRVSRRAVLSASGLAGLHLLLGRGQSACAVAEFEESCGSGAPIFSADVGLKGLSAYSHVIHPETVSVVEDPTGVDEMVLRCTVPDSAVGPTDNPRAQLEPPGSLRNGDTFYFGFAILLPADFPSRLPPSDGRDVPFINVCQLYGPPYGGSPPFKLGVSTREKMLSWKRADASGVGYGQACFIPYKTDEWLYIRGKIRLSSEPYRGFVALQYNLTGRSESWQYADLQPGRGESAPHGGRLYARTLTTNAVGPNRFDIMLYRRRGLWDSVTAYFKRHQMSLQVIDPTHPA